MIVRRADPETTILRALLDAGDEFVSGTVLAHALQMSRVAVWQHMEKLREQGFTFETARAKGYRLTARPAALNAALITATLPPALLRDFTLRVCDEVDSTNDEVARLLAAGQRAPCAIIARRQNKGRGRLGRRWLSEANGNLYLSLGFRPPLAPARMATFTLWTGVSIAKLIGTFCRTEARLKWPNDLLLDGRKVGGILTEARIDADQMRDLVIGIGLNLQPPSQGWPPELRAQATSLSEQVATVVDPNRFTAALIGCVLTAYHRFVDGSYLDTFADLWNHFDALRGREITLLQGDRRITGVARGIDDVGSLLVRTTAGKTERFHAGEATLAKPSR